jgi:hypothetical protein
LGIVELGERFLLYTIGPPCSSGLGLALGFSEYAQPLLSFGAEERRRIRATPADDPRPAVDAHYLACDISGQIAQQKQNDVGEIARRPLTLEGDGFHVPGELSGVRGIDPAR